MSRVKKLGGNAIAGAKRRVVFVGAKLQKRLLGIFGGVKGHVFFAAASLGFAVAPRSFKLLNMRRVHQHYIA